MPPLPPPSRLLIVLPSWVGDTVMATPALARIRAAMPGAFIGALCRPGIDRLIAGADFLDEVHTFTPHGVMAPKRAAGKVRPRRYDAALLLTNSFSTALITRLAFIPRRIGYNRDNRAVLLTDPVAPPRNPDRSWKLTPAVDYYWNLASHLLNQPPVDWSVHTPTNCVSVPLALPPDARMQLPVTSDDERAADELIARAGLAPDRPFAILNPGGNNPAKRWPADRYARLAEHLITQHNLTVLINGSPAESDLCASIRDQLAPTGREGMASPPIDTTTNQSRSAPSRPHPTGREGMASPPADTTTSQSRSAPSRPHPTGREGMTSPPADAMALSLPDLGITLGALKALCRRARLMVTNDTGPRHIAAATGTPLVTLFGPTDPRWTTIPVRAHADATPAETILVADPDLPPDRSANDHPDRCRVDRITLAQVTAAADDQLARR